MRTSWHSGICQAVMVIMFAPAIQGQEPPPDEAQRPAPAGIRVSSLSGYVGGYSLRFPEFGTDSISRADMLLAGGGAADLIWNIPGRRTEAVLTYHGAYTRNQRFSELNGFDHAFSFALRMNRGRRTTFGLEAAGESTLLGNAIFTPAPSLTVAQQSASAADLASGLADNLAVDRMASPLVLMLAGGRRMMGVMQLRLTHSHSPRLESHLSVGAIRERRSLRSAPEFAAAYPSVTLGVAEAGISYAVSRRSHLSWAADYWRSYSRAYRFDVETATMGWDRTIGRRSFGRLEGGYTRTAFLGDGRSARNGYNASAAIGTIKGNHTLIASFRRGVADLNGLHADSTAVVDGSWAWSRLASPWALASSFGYERMAGALGPLDTWLYHGSVSRRLTTTLRLQLEGAYANSTTADLMDFARRGARLSLVWTPGEAPVRVQ